MTASLNRGRRRELRAVVVAASGGIPLVVAFDHAGEVLVLEMGVVPEENGLTLGRWSRVGRPARWRRMGSVPVPQDVLTEMAEVLTQAGARRVFETWRAGQVDEAGGRR